MFQPSTGVCCPHTHLEAWLVDLWIREGTPLSRDKITDRLFYTGVGLGIVAVVGAGVAVFLVDISPAQTPKLFTTWVWVVSLALGFIACVVLLVVLARLRRTIRGR
jgi:hypothetical protein